MTKSIAISEWFDGYSVFKKLKKNIQILDIIFVFRYIESTIHWSDGRVVERGGLENRYTLTGIGGSNPSRSVLYDSLQGFARNFGGVVER